MLYEQRANGAVTTRLSRANHALFDAIRSYKTSILGRGSFGTEAVAPNGKKNTFEIGCKGTTFF